jgi:primosomal replication protein N
VQAGENSLVLGGSVCTRPETRFSAAGIPISRFTLEHRSQQVEAGVPRDISFRVAVLAAGETLQAEVARLELGSTIRVRGFLGRAGGRADDGRLVLHAIAVERLTH